MKKLFLLAAATMLLSFLVFDPISKKERSYAAKLLKDTEKDLKGQLKGLSETQLKWKPAPDKWSIEECVKHIAASEGMFWQRIEGTVKEPANPDKRAEIKVTDEKLVQMIEDRSHKAKTNDKLEPDNSGFKSADEAFEAFKKKRGALTEYVKSTNDDLRNHVATTPVGMVDSYQLILFTAAHSNRHTQQIMEIKADANFPK